MTYCATGTGADFRGFALERIAQHSGTSVDDASSAMSLCGILFSKRPDLQFTGVRVQPTQCPGKEVFCVAILLAETDRDRRPTETTDGFVCESGDIVRVQGLEQADEPAPGSTAVTALAQCGSCEWANH